MIWVIFAILLLVWLFGFTGGYIFGDLIHLLLVGALFLVIFNAISRAQRRLTANRNPSGPSDFSNPGKYHFN